MTKPCRGAVSSCDCVSPTTSRSSASAATDAKRSIAIREQRPDLVFLDIQMPGLSGFDVLAQLQPHELPMIVFVTAYDRFAVQAFEARAIDYVLKPVDDARLAAPRSPMCAN